MGRRAATRRRQTPKRYPCKPAHCQASPSCNLPPLADSQSPFCLKHQNSTAFSPLSGSEPDYIPEAWNTPDDLRQSHNCFAYAFNVWDQKRRDQCKNGNCSFAQPGYAAGYPPFSARKFKTCADMKLRLEGDNKIIQPSTFEKKPPSGYSKIAVIVDPNADFHFLRLDSNGYWSHKPGATNVTNKDSDGRLIVRPDLANFCYPDKREPLHYWKFCQYYDVPRVQRVFVQGGRLTRRRRQH